MVFKEYSQGPFSWNGNRITLPSPLPVPASPVTVESPWNIVLPIITAPFLIRRLLGLEQMAAGD